MVATRLKQQRETFPLIPNHFFFWCAGAPARPTVEGALLFCFCFASVLFLFCFVVNSNLLLLLLLLLRPPLVAARARNLANPFLCGLLGRGRRRRRLQVGCCSMLFMLGAVVPPAKLLKDLFLTPLCGCSCGPAG